MYMILDEVELEDATAISYDNGLSMASKAGYEVGGDEGAVSVAKIRTGVTSDNELSF